MGTVNYIYGNQGFLTSIYSPPISINSFGDGGYNPGFAAGGYYYTLTRSGSFTTSNLQFAFDWVTWVNGSSHVRWINNASHYISISGVIPYGTECSNILNETVVMKIYTANTYQLVQTTTFIIKNPLNPVPVSNFKIFGSATSSPAIIYGCGCPTPNILLLNLPLKYTGTGTVWKYRISIKEVNAAGTPIAGGFTFIQNWINAAVPLSTTINSALMGTGVTSGQVPAYWAYYLISLETAGVPCTSGTSMHAALIHLSRAACIK